MAKDLALNLVQPECECFKTSAGHIWGPAVAPTACNPHLNLKTRETGLLSETSTLWEPSMVSEIQNPLQETGCLVVEKRGISISKGRM